MKNRRRSKRFHAKKKVMLGEDDEPQFLASTLNISKNGTAIESGHAFFPNSKIVIKFYSPDCVMLLDGIVKWMRPDTSRTFYKLGIKLSDTFQDCYKLTLH